MHSASQEPAEPASGGQDSALWRYQDGAFGRLEGRVPCLLTREEQVRRARRARATGAADAVEVRRGLSEQAQGGWAEGGRLRGMDCGG